MHETYYTLQNAIKNEYKAYLGYIITQQSLVAIAPNLIKNN